MCKNLQIVEFNGASKALCVVIVTIALAGLEFTQHSCLGPLKFLTIFINFSLD